MRLLGDQQRQGDGVIRAAEVVAAVAEEKQRDREQVPAGDARLVHLGAFSRGDSALDFVQDGERVGNGFRGVVGSG